MGFRKRDAVTGKPLPYLLNTRTFMNHTLYAPYVYLPIACACCWLAALLAMIALWVSSGKPRYRYDEPSTVFISNVAGVHKWVFVPLCACTVGFYVASLLAERALRAADHLPTDVRRRTIWFGWVSIIFAACGGAALILLGVFDCFKHSTVHWTMACVFIVCVAFSAIFQTGQVWSLHKDHPHRKSLWRNSMWKLLFVVVAVCGAIAFGSTYAVCRGKSTPRKGKSAHKCDLISSAAAALEWTIAFILFFYFLTLAGDMWPASKYSRRYKRKLTTWREKQGWPAQPAPVVLHDPISRSGLNAEPIDQWETVQPVDTDSYPTTATTTTAYGKPVMQPEYYDPEHAYAAQPRDWDFVQSQQYDRQGMAYPPVGQQQQQYEAQQVPPSSQYATTTYTQPAAHPEQGMTHAERMLRRYSGSYTNLRDAPYTNQPQTYTTQPVAPPAHPEQPPVSYQPTGAERIDPQQGWQQQQHSSWRGTCTPEDVQGFRAPASPGPNRAIQRETEYILPSNAY